MEEEHLHGAPAVVGEEEGDEGRGLPARPHAGRQPGDPRLHQLHLMERILFPQINKS